MTEIHLPLSQARRRLNQILRHLSRHPKDVFCVTRKGEVWLILVSKDYYDEFLGLMTEAERLLDENTHRDD